MALLTPRQLLDLERRSTELFNELELYPDDDVLANEFCCVHTRLTAARRAAEAALKALLISSPSRPGRPTIINELSSSSMTVAGFYTRAGSIYSKPLLSTKD